MNQPITIAIVGLGGRGMDSYGEALLAIPQRAKVVAIADPDPKKLEKMARVHGVAAENCFRTAEDLLAQDKLADAILICTQDKQHVNHAVPALEKGYDVLMEKPISPELEECKRLLAVSRRTGRKVIVCHVMRYAPMNRKVKEILESGVLGRLISIQSLENIGYWHYAHSYVRGNWRRREDTSPMILAKCCHDMDIMVWFTGKKCRTVSSFGDLSWFKSENAPEGSALRCVDCQVKADCPYDAEKVYLSNKGTGLLHGNHRWPVNILALDPTEESVRQALANGPYGRCVYHCDNNVADHQVVNLLMEDGLTINFTASAFTPNILGRHTRFMGTKGEMTLCVERENTIIVKPFGGEPVIYDFNTSKPHWASGHGGGDSALINDFLDALEGKDVPGLSTLDVSMESHFMAMAAEESRLNGGKAIEMRTVR